VLSKFHKNIITNVPHTVQEYSPCLFVCTNVYGLQKEEFNFVTHYSLNLVIYDYAGVE